MVRTRDGGASWQGVPFPRSPFKPPLIPPDSPAVATVRFADAMNGWITLGSSLYYTHDAGVSWHRVTWGLLITGLGIGAGYVYLTTNGCGGFQGGPTCQITQVWAAPIGSSQPGQFHRVSPVIPGQMRSASLVVQGADWYLATPATIYHGGATAAAKLTNPCTQHPSDPYAPLTRMPALAVADAQHLDAMCVGEGAAGSARYQLYGTTDGGQHWTAAGPSHTLASGIYGIADNNNGVLLVATASGGSEILRSTNDGTTLNQAAIKTAGDGTGWSDLGFTTPSRAVVVLDATTLYLSHDAGSSWTPVHF